MTLQTLAAHHLATVQATLGEGPVWDPGAEALWFVDIEQQEVHRYRPGEERTVSWAAPAKVGWVLPLGGGGLLAGLADGICRFTPDDGGFRPIPGGQLASAGTRLNDAAVGPAGDVWLGTMDEGEQKPLGRYYRFDGQVLHALEIPPVCITNGPAVSPDGRRLFTVDTLGRRIEVRAIGSNGALGEARVFAELTAAEGYPDGVTCDAEGGVWLAIWGGWKARRYDLAGRATHEVSLPVANVTKVALGGPDGRTAFVTTARRGLEPAALAAQPLAGDIFTFQAPVAGLPIARAKAT